MTEARPPGWYDEPGGDRASLRWWDGRSWTSVTRVRSPSEQLPAAAPAEVLDSERPPSASRRGWVVAGVVTAIVLLVAVVGVPGRKSGEGDLARPGAGPATLLPPEPIPTTPTPVTGRITDRVARLTYDVLPGPWREWDRDVLLGMRSTIGYYRVTQENAPNAQTYYANVNSGPVADDTDVPGDLAGTARAVLAGLQRYYPRHTRSGLTQSDLRVDGAAASVIRYRAVFDPAAAQGYAAKSEEIVVLVVDVGEPMPSVLYVSLPDTVSPLWPSIDPLLASVRVVR